MTRKHAPKLAAVPSAKESFLAQWPECTCKAEPYTEGVAVHVVRLPNQNPIAWAGNEVAAWTFALRFMERNPDCYRAAPPRSVVSRMVKQQRAYA